MKMNSILKRTSLAISITGLFCGITTAQDQSQAMGKSEATIELSYYKKADMSKTAVALITAKNKDGKFVPVKNARVSFYMQNNNEQQFLKNVYTDNKGQALIELRKEMPLDTGSAFIIVAKIENDSLYENAEEKIRYKEANINIKLNPQDTSRTATAVVTQIDNDGKEIPVKGADLKFYVQRLFGMMPAAEDNTISTDEKGEAAFAFPKNIPGDTAGLITISARMEDNAQYGNVENKANASWGNRLLVDKDPFPRALWEPYAPLPLIITISTLFGGVWFIYFFIFYQLRKISKEKKLNTVNEQNS